MNEFTKNELYPEYFYKKLLHLKNHCFKWIKKAHFINLNDEQTELAIKKNNFVL